MFTPGIAHTRLACLTALALCAAALHGSAARAQQDSILVRIGWQPTTTVEAQIAHVLQRTDILERKASSPCSRSGRL
jgi:hypothetical protein